MNATGRRQALVSFDPVDQERSQGMLWMLVNGISKRLYLANAEYMLSFGTSHGALNSSSLLIKLVGLSKQSRVASMAKRRYAVLPFRH